MPEQPSLFPRDADQFVDEYLLKHVNAVALMPIAGGRRITLLGRRVFNVLLRRAQEAGAQEEYEARMHEILEDASYKSNDTAPIRKILRELMQTTVEWQSPSNGEIETWDACNLLSGAGTTKDKKTGAVTVRWRYDTKVREQLLSPDRYARLSLEAITQLSSHSAMALYEICARYIDNPSHKTARQHWRWWKPVLTGVPVTDGDTKAEYRFFKRDVVNKAMAEINARTNLEVRGPFEFKERDNRTIAEIQFEVYLKSDNETPMPLTDIGPESLPLVGRAVQAGVKQFEIEELIRKHGPGLVFAGLDELDKRLQMPSVKVGQVLRPGGWLRSQMSRVTKDAKAAKAAGQGGSTSKPVDLTDTELSKRRAAWTDEWLRRRKERLRNGFRELGTERQTELLAAFRSELETGTQPQLLKRFDSSGWKHQLVVGAFTRFIAHQEFGDGWDKATSDDLLAIAAEFSESGPKGR